MGNGGDKSTVDETTISLVWFDILPPPRNTMTVLAETLR